MITSIWNTISYYLGYTKASETADGSSTEAPINNNRKRKFDDLSAAFVCKHEIREIIRKKKQKLGRVEHALQILQGDYLNDKVKKHGTYRQVQARDHIIANLEAQKERLGKELEIDEGNLIMVPVVRLMKDMKDEFEIPTHFETFEMPKDYGGLDSVKTE